MSILSARWILWMKASIWRGLMAVGMRFHHFASPKPPRPNFKILIPSRLSSVGGMFKLVFYVPPSYYDAPPDFRFPVVINYHGGGFTLGTGTDDARWAAFVVREVGAVVVSVEYRLAPEYPFSVGVEDGTDALIYIAAHAEELRLDPHRIALSGFSAGGNFAFTVPLMLNDLRNDVGKRHLECDNDTHNSKKSRGYLKVYDIASAASSALSLPRPLDHSASAVSSTLSLPHPERIGTRSSTASIMKLTDLTPTELEISQVVPDLTLRCLVSFYPPTDFRIPRDVKRASNPMPQLNLPPLLTDLFDEAYLSPKSKVDFSDPYLSPAAATTDSLRESYPNDVVLYTCEYDMLNAEGIAFGELLASSEVGRTVHGGLIKGAVHAFDKKPNPLSFPLSAIKCYAEACAELRRVFGGKSTIEELRQLDKCKTVERFEDGEIPSAPHIDFRVEGPDGEEEEIRTFERPGSTQDTPSQLSNNGKGKASD